MTERWKIQRELGRIGLQIYDKISYPFQRIVQHRYDRDFPKITKLTNGAQKSSDHVAIFFVYQPKGFDKSVAVTCDFLKSKGYSIILVSSGPIGAEDLVHLSEKCWKILERPNYGYDFGGYRDGLRVMYEAKIAPETLIIINDSIWFPLDPMTTIIERLDEARDAFNGTVYVDKPGRSNKSQHFQSFLFHLTREAIESRAFVSYWKNYKVNSAKRVVLLQGEKGFSQAMFNGGFNSDLRATDLVIFDRLTAMPNSFLRSTLNYAAYDDVNLAVDARNLLHTFQDTPEWRKDVLAHMKIALSRTHPLGIFIYATMLLMDFSFLKKRSFAQVFDGMRWQYLRAVKNGDLPAPHPDILSEIMTSKMDGRLTTDPSIPIPVAVTKMP